MNHQNSGASVIDSRTKQRGIKSAQRKEEAIKAQIPVPQTAAVFRLRLA